MDSNRGSTGQLSSSGGSVGGGMHHSLSTPAGVDGGARTPPATPKKGGKMLAVRVQMLDDSVTVFQVQVKGLGSILFEQVCKQLHLLEADYFGLEYSDNHGTKYWLDLQKPMSRQLGLSLVDPFLQFCVKFYTPDPGQLEEEYTRYLFCLQVKRDLSQGMMQCNENTAALMASYIVQAECGDYVSEDYPDHTYLSTYKFVPQQDHEMERKIMENHKKHSSQSPAEADLNLLETARRCELYGIKMHPAKDHENVPLNLAVAHMGIIVFQNYTKINTFSWAKIRKISFKRKRFLIKLHPEGYGYYKDTVEFFFEGRNECKNFWKKCVENHGFFRCSSVKNISRHKTRVLSRGSSFRYSGKTQKQVVEFVRDNYVKRQAFQRSASFRHSSAHSSASNMHNSTVGNSISAHPLLPLADSNLSVEVSKLSASLGSMGAGAPVSPTTTRSASRHLGTATSWSSAPDTRPTTLHAQRTTLPSPPETTQSSAITSPLHIDRINTTNKSPCVNSAVAVLAAVHRADTGTTTRTPTIRMPSSHKSEGSLDHPAPPTFTNHYPSQTQSQNDLIPKAQKSAETKYEYVYSVPVLPRRQLWQRSASCRDLYDFSFEDSGQAKRRAKPPKPIEKAVISFEERQLESPITRYDDHHLIFSTSRDSSLEIHQDIMMPDQKVYSSSYPGTTSYSQESVEDPGNYDLRDSQDDISHDSYELLEKSDDEYSHAVELIHYTKPKTLNTRSCSLDSGNYIPSDSDSDEKQQKCKSTNDVYQDIFLMEDPRDLPREIIPRKSDGSFYKNFKIGSRTSSLESKSDYYESKTSKSSKDRSFDSRTSSQESKSDNEFKTVRRNKSAENIKCKKHDYLESRSSSLESKSEYYDAASKFDESRFVPHKTGEYDRRISFERNYGVQKARHEAEKSINDYNDFARMKETSHVHSISLQNVETEQNMRCNRITSNFEQNTIPRAQKSNHHVHRLPKTDINSHNKTAIWPEALPGVPTEIDWHKQPTRSTESESNIFSFEEDKIQSLQESSETDQGFSVVPNLENGKQDIKRKNYRDVFMEIEPRLSHEMPLHQPIERTKSDPNSLARQRLNSNRRLLLMHQKSFDLTPYESSDEDYIYKQIPSAPPITKYKGTHFEMPTAEFGHFDILKREIEGQKTKFEVPKSQFEILGAKTQSDFINLPPKDEDLTYVLHKRHVMNGTAQKDEIKKLDSPGVRKNSQQPQEVKKLADEIKLNSKLKAESESSFLFTQNIDLSKVDPVTLEVDKSHVPVQHLSSPKRDITHIDPVLLEALNSKLSQIESDSPTSSKTESIKPIHKIFVMQNDRQVKKDLKKVEDQAIQTNVPVPAKVEEKKVVPEKPKPKEAKIKTDIKSKRIIKPRMQPGKKGRSNKTKVRITSFSSDDESLDSDDVFGSAEATPTRIEFSPPQMRKEMESILKFESERKYLQYTMSSTEVEGSPPTTRKKTKEPYDNGLDPNLLPGELRRISERSISIPSSEDDFNIKTTDMQPVFAEPIADGLNTVEEMDKEDGDKSYDETLKEELSDEKELTTIDEERERDKELLMADIEDDIRNLEVPPKTKITEIMTSPTSRKKGQSPMFFAHARLNLSEGTAFTLLQKQQAMESPISGRRAKSLDTPIIQVNRLPPLNSFSSKDDTVDEEEHIYTSIEETVSDKSIQEENEELKVQEVVKPVIKEKPVPVNKPTKEVKPKEKLIKVERDQIVPDVIKSKKPSKTTVQTKVAASKNMIKAKTAAKNLSPKELKAVTKSLAPKPSKPTAKPPVQVKPAAPTPQLPQKREVDKPPLPEQRSLPENSLTLPEIKRTKSQEIESNKKHITKEKARSFEKLELRRTNSKERAKSQDDSDTDIVKRKEKQQMLYEIAIKQTKTIKSPVKDVLPVFPQVEESVRERHGRLEISINTIEPNVSLEEAIIITKSPKRLDKKIEQTTKSLDLDGKSEDNKIQRLGKSLDLDSRPKEEENEFNFNIETISSIQARDLEENSPDSGGITETVTVDVHGVPDSEKEIILEGTSLDVWLSVEESKKKEIEKLGDIEILKKSNDFFEQRESAKPPDLAKSSSDSRSSTERYSLGNSLDIKFVDDSPSTSAKSSDQDALLIAEMKKASLTMSKFLKRKIEKRREDESTSSSVKTDKDSLEEDEMQKATGTMSKFIKRKLEKRREEESKSSSKPELPDAADIKKLNVTMSKFIKRKLEKRREEESVNNLKPETQSDELPDAADIQKLNVTMSKFIKRKLEKRREEEAQKAEQEEKGRAEMDKANNTMAKFLRHKLDNRKIPESIVKITSEDESLTEVSDLKCETIDKHLLGYTDHKDALLKLSIERSRSEDTGSWVTVECDEFIGNESSLDYDNTLLDSPEKPVLSFDKSEEPAKEEEPTKDIKIEEKTHLLTTDTLRRFDLLKRSSDQSRSSDTTGSWTSGDKESSPGNLRETDESSVSCSMGRAIGFSQNIEIFSTKEQLEKGSPDSEPPRSPRSPRICVLGRAFTIDEESISQKIEGGSSSDEANEIPKDVTSVTEKTTTTTDETDSNKTKIPYPFEEKWSNDSELSQRLHKKLSKKISSADKSMSSVDDSVSSRKNGLSNRLDKPSLYSVEKLSTESRNSLDTESDSGSLGAAYRMGKSGDIPKDLSSTWKPFPLDSSGSESFDDNLLPPDHDLEKHEYFLCRDNSADGTNLSDIFYKSGDTITTPTKDDTVLPEDLANLRLTSGIATIGIGSDILINYAGPGFLSRTLSRISERSTNSEKSSLEEDSTKASASDSLNDESMESSNQKESGSSGSVSNARVSEQDKKTPTNEFPSQKQSESRSKLSQERISTISSLLQRQISDDRRTSAEMAELSIDDIEIISERGLRLKRQNSDDTIIDEEFEPEYKDERQSSQESEDWPLPEIPNQGQKTLLAMHEVQSSDTSQQTTQVFQPPKSVIPKTFGLRSSLKSQDSEKWPSPPSSIIEPPIIGNVETYYMTPPEEAHMVLVDSNTNTGSTYDNDSNSDNENKTLDLDTEKTHTYENVPTERVEESISESLSLGPSGIKITLRKSGSGGSGSDEDLNISNLNDDVFTESADSRNELRPQTVMRRSTGSDDSYNKDLKPGSPRSSRGSHSSYSEEDCTSSPGTSTNLDGTVRYALKPTKCTHSSHSEDTSIALSLSEWSNSTNTVKFQNLSSNSGTTKSSSGLKSDENSLTDIAQSISEWSSSNSTLKAQQGAASNIQFQKLSELSTTSTGDSTLTDLIPTISDWSTSDSATRTAKQQLFSKNIPERSCISRMGTSLEVDELAVTQEGINVPSPKNIPSEDLAIFSTSLPSRTDKFFTKSTERPVVIPVHSDTDSSVEQRTVHIQRYDKDKQRYLQKHQPTSKSLDRGTTKVPLKLAKCSPYYSSSLSSESTPLASTSPIPLSKTATVPLTRSHRKPVSKSLCQAKSPPSENDSTSSVESPRSKSERDRRGYRRKRQTQNQRRMKFEREQSTVDEYYYVEHESGLTEYNEYIRNRAIEEMVLAEQSIQYAEAIEEGYIPDGDSQSGSDIFRMERDEDDKYEAAEGFDVTSIPPPLLEDDFEDHPSHI